MELQLLIFTLEFPYDQILCDHISLDFQKGLIHIGVVMLNPLKFLFDSGPGRFFGLELSEEPIDFHLGLAQGLIIDLRNWVWQGILWDLEIIPMRS